MGEGVGLGILLLLSRLPYYSSLTQHTLTRSAPLHTHTCLCTPHVWCGHPRPAGLSLSWLRTALGFATWAPWGFSLLGRLYFSPQPEPWLDKRSWVLGLRRLQAAGGLPGLLLSPGLRDGRAPVGPRGQGVIWLSRDAMSSHTKLGLCSPGAQIGVLWLGDGLTPQPVHTWWPGPRWPLEGIWDGSQARFSFPFSLICLAGAGTSAWGGGGTGRLLVPRRKPGPGSGAAASPQMAHKLKDPVTSRAPDL